MFDDHGLPENELARNRIKNVMHFLQQYAHHVKARQRSYDPQRSFATRRSVVARYPACSAPPP
ncbi:hypothetical protein KDA_72770 [Dictyobacter alpinus]|uniref:Uncharacterized protein n=1 Tax=Dictyobacter alpinus TaxID=2014873 RepID=A0A402BKB3_9CHLR|nr:hypothetical protein [Dictyobacter alpinus]GCE31793.1 hypothetical protein KDA_72770 [Dictyobacter alpinus]